MSKRLVTTFVLPILGTWMARAGGPGQSRTADLRFRKSQTFAENKVDKQSTPADSGKVLQNPQPPRNKPKRKREG
jgi:hypothetical protein